MELNHVNLPVADVSATRDFFEMGSDLEQTMTGAKTLEAQIADGTAKTEGDDLEAVRLDHGRVRPPLRDHARYERQHRSWQRRTHTKRMISARRSTRSRPSHPALALVTMRNAPLT